MAVTVQSAAVAGVTPGWVRLTRTGDLITAYRSLDGASWTVIGSDSFPMADAVYVGIAVTSRNVAATATAIVTNLVLTQSQANQPPTATLTAPANGATFTAPASIGLTANAADADGTVARVDFYNGTTLLGSDATAPYAFAWTNVAAGSYTLKAVAVDNAGASTSSATATVTVSPAANQPPTAALTAPASGATFIAPASIDLTANAADADGTVARVDFYNGTTLLGSDATAPYAFTWTNVPAGTYALKATAVDNSGAIGSSATATVTVAAAAGLPAGQQAVDIGAPVLSGSTSYSNGTYTTSAGGAAIYNNADHFQFIYQSVSGDLDISLHVASVTAAYSYSSAGVMIRESLAAGSRHAHMLLSAGRGYSFNERLQTDGVTTGTAGGSPAPGWVRLTRQGNLISGFVSTDGQTWTAVGTTTVSMTSAVYVGIAVTAGPTRRVRSP